ncbi:MAG: hypothetical protein J7L54_04510 [Elusimicrobia bacterium]|nr:hypothetical protein [Elusimicrobiota bacterium]
MRIKAPAKINLFLDAEIPAVGDGFHRILTLAGKISLFDEICVTESRRMSLKIKSRWKIPSGAKNICLKAVEVMRKFSDFGGVKIVLEKNIPPGQGLGGGSSDAAAVIMAINKIFDLGLEKRKLFEIGFSVGSDVPLFTEDETFCWISGRGEIVKPVPLKIEAVPVLWFGRRISTRKVYEKIDEKIKRRKLKSSFGKFPGFFNILEKAAFEIMQVLQKRKSIFLKEGAFASFMTGSGSAVVGLFETFSAAKKFCEKYPFCKIARFL